MRGGVLDAEGRANLVAEGFGLPRLGDVAEHVGAGRELRLYLLALFLRELRWPSEACFVLGRVVDGALFEAVGPVVDGRLWNPVPRRDRVSTPTPLLYEIATISRFADFASVACGVRPGAAPSRYPPASTWSLLSLKCLNTFVRGCYNYFHYIFAPFVC